MTAIQPRLARRLSNLVDRRQVDWRRSNERIIKQLNKPTIEPTEPIEQIEPNDNYHEAFPPSRCVSSIWTTFADAVYARSVRVAVGCLCPRAYEWDRPTKDSTAVGGRFGRRIKAVPAGRDTGPTCG